MHIKLSITGPSRDLCEVPATTGVGEGVTHTAGPDCTEPIDKQPAPARAESRSTARGPGYPYGPIHTAMSSAGALGPVLASESSDIFYVSGIFKLIVIIALEIQRRKGSEL